MFICTFYDAVASLKPTSYLTLSLTWLRKMLHLLLQYGFASSMSSWLLWLKRHRLFCCTTLCVQRSFTSAAVQGLIGFGKFSYHSFDTIMISKLGRDSQIFGWNSSNAFVTSIKMDLFIWLARIKNFKITARISKGEEIIKNWIIRIGYLLLK